MRQKEFTEIFIDDVYYLSMFGFSPHDDIRSCIFGLAYLGSLHCDS